MPLPAETVRVPLEPWIDAGISMMSSLISVLVERGDMATIGRFVALEHIPAKRHRVINFLRTSLLAVARTRGLTLHQADAELEAIADHVTKMLAEGAPS